MRLLSVIWKWGNRVHLPPYFVFYLKSLWQWLRWFKLHTATLDLPRFWWVAHTCFVATWRQFFLLYRWRLPITLTSHRRVYKKLLMWWHNFSVSFPWPLTPAPRVNHDRGMSRVPTFFRHITVLGRQILLIDRWASNLVLLLSALLLLIEHWTWKCVALFVFL